MSSIGDTDRVVGDSNVDKGTAMDQLLPRTGLLPLKLASSPLATNPVMALDYSITCLRVRVNPA